VAIGSDLIAQQSDFWLEVIFGAPADSRFTDSQIVNRGQSRCRGQFCVVSGVSGFLNYGQSGNYSRTIRHSFFCCQDSEPLQQVRVSVF
jgi:hypothetical protein